MGEVSKKLMDQFADNLNAMLDEQSVAALTSDPDPDPEPNPTVAPDPAVAPAAESEPASAAPTADEPRVRKIDGPAAEPIDMAGLAGPALLKRLGPVVAAVLLVLLVLRRKK